MLLGMALPLGMVKPLVYESGGLSYDPEKSNWCSDSPMKEYGRKVLAVTERVGVEQVSGKTVREVLEVRAELPPL
jgi:hypothetical protein